METIEASRPHTYNHLLPTATDTIINGGRIGRDPGGLTANITGLSTRKGENPSASRADDGKEESAVLQT